MSGIAEKLESQDKVNDLAEVSKQAERTVQEWLAVLAHCFRLQDGIAVLELDRVLDASPGEYLRVWEPLDIEVGSHRYWL